MTSPPDKPVPELGALPRAIAPEQQVTAPIPIGQQQPWAYPHFAQPGLQVDLKKQAGAALDIIKILGFVVSIGTIVFGAGAAHERLKIIEANQTADREQQAQHNRLLDDRADKNNSAVTEIARQVRELNERLRAVRITRIPVRRERDTDRPMPPGP